MALEQLEPFGWERENLLMGQIAAQIFNSRPGNKQAFSPKDFMFRPRREMTTEEMIRNLKAATR